MSKPSDPGAGWKPGTFYHVHDFKGDRWWTDLDTLALSLSSNIHCKSSQDYYSPFDIIDMAGEMVNFLKPKSTMT